MDLDQPYITLSLGKKIIDFHLKSPPHENRPPDIDIRHTEEIQRKVSQYHKKGGSRSSQTTDGSSHFKVTFVVLRDVLEKWLGPSRVGSKIYQFCVKKLKSKQLPKHLLAFIILVQTISEFSNIENYELLQFYKIAQKIKEVLDREYNFCYPEQIKKKKLINSKIKYLAQIIQIMKNLYELNYDQTAMKKLWKFCRHGRYKVEEIQDDSQVSDNDQNLPTITRARRQVKRTDAFEILRSKVPKYKEISERQIKKLLRQLEN